MGKKEKKGMKGKKEKELSKGVLFVHPWLESTTRGSKRNVESSLSSSFKDFRVQFPEAWAFHGMGQTGSKETKSLRFSYTTTTTASTTRTFTTNSHHVFHQPSHFVLPAHCLKEFTTIKWRQFYSHYTILNSNHHQL